MAGWALPTACPMAILPAVLHPNDPGGNSLPCAGEPVELKKAVCMHEEDAGLLWKHLEYRTGHAESRRCVRPPPFLTCFP